MSCISWIIKMLGWLFTMLIELDQQNRLKAHKMSSKGVCSQRGTRLSYQMTKYILYRSTQKIKFIKSKWVPHPVDDLMESTVFHFSRMYSLFIEFPTKWIIMHIWKCTNGKRVFLRNRDSIKNVVTHNAWNAPKDWDRPKRQAESTFSNGKWHHVTFGDKTSFVSKHPLSLVTTN